MPDPSRQMLRHTVATLAYRASKATRGAPEGFSEFALQPGSRTPGEILAHMGDLFDWALSLAKGEERWADSKPRTWDADVRRLFASLSAFDAYLASPAALHVPAEGLFQGPVADALTHTGQIAMQRRLAGAPIRGENYSIASIAAGQAGFEQPPPKGEFG